MKNYRTKIVGLSVIAIFLAIAFSFISINEKDKIIIVRTFESEGNFCKVIVTDSKKTIKTVELEPFRSKNVEDNTIKITEVLNDIENQGFSLASSNTHDEKLYNMTTYVFERK